MLSNCLATRIVFYWRGNTLFVLTLVILLSPDAYLFGHIILSARLR